MERVYTKESDARGAKENKRSDYLGDPIDVVSVSRQYNCPYYGVKDRPRIEGEATATELSILSNGPSIWRPGIE